MEMKLENLEAMTDVEERVFWRMFDVQLARDDGSAARAHLQAGRPVYYREDSTPSGLVVKEFPNGARELVRFVNGVEQMVSNASIA